MTSQHTKPLAFGLVLGLTLSLMPVLMAGQNAVPLGRDFGDDSGPYPHDGECEDPRFEGNWVSPLANDEGLKRDASDCRTLVSQGLIRWRAAPTSDAGLGDTIRLGAALHGYYGERTPLDIRLSTSFSSDREAEAVVDRIMRAVALSQNFAVRGTRDVPNAAAVRCQMLDSRDRYRLCSSSGQDRLLLYNPSFMDDMRQASGSSWSGISIMAHEVGHHLNDHTIDARGSRPPIELEADKFSGGVLQKLGATLEQAQAVISTFPERGSSTHPGRRDRLEAIRAGWQESYDLVGPRTSRRGETPGRQRDAEARRQRDAEARRQRDAEARRQRDAEARRQRDAEARRQQERWRAYSNTCRTVVGACPSQPTLPVGAPCTCTWFNQFGQPLTYPGNYVRDR